MKTFDNFKLTVKSDYRMIHDKVSLTTDRFVEEHNYPPERRNEVYSELFIMELLERYHDWNNS